MLVSFKKISAAAADSGKKIIFQVFENYSTQ